MKSGIRWLRQGGAVPGVDLGVRRRTTKIIMCFSMKKACLIEAALLIGALMQPTLLSGQINDLMPQPAEVTPQQGRLAIDGSFRVALTGYREPRLQAAAERLIQRLSRQTGIPFAGALENGPSKATLV